MVEVPRSNLARLARAGDQEAFTELVAPLLQAGFALAVSLSPDRAAAEDAVQEALLRSWSRLRQLRDDSRLRSWFLGIVVNECRVAQRRRSRLLRREASTFFPVSDPWSEDVDARADLLRALSALKLDDRAVLAVRFLLDSSVDEAARILHVSPGAVKSRTMRAAERLRKRLEAEGWE